RANLLASAKKIEEDKAARAAAKALPKPAPPAFGDGHAFLDDARIKLAIESLCTSRTAATVRSHKPEEDVAAMRTNEWATTTGQAPPTPPPTTTDEIAPPAPPPRQPKKPKAGGESFEWESSGEWEQKGM